MKKKILALVMTLTMLIGSLLAEGTTPSEHTTTGHQVKEIQIAIYSMNVALFSNIERYFEIFDGFEWQAGDRTYRFTMTTLDAKAILRGELTVEKYDVFTIGWWEATQMNMQLGCLRVKHMLLQRRIADFISDGGGYFGSCAAAVIMTSGLANTPSTIYEHLIDRGTLRLSTVHSYLEGGYIMLAQKTGHPEKIGQVAYDWYSGWGGSNYTFAMGGCSLNVSIDKQNPIFNDVIEDTRLISWVGGPGLEVPQNSSNVTVIASYPSEEISANQSTRIHAWKYTGRPHGVLKSFLNNLKTGETLFDSVFFAPFKATDWEMTDTIIQTHLANKAFMTLETYPNQHQGRMALCAGHPESKAWVGGHIEEEPDTSTNNLYTSLFHWANVTKVYEPSYNWCIFRREAAWAGKVPDNDFLPIYGASQVSNIDPYVQPSPCLVTGTVVHENEGATSVELFYRYSHDNSSWDAWKGYGTDTNGSDGWSWMFDASSADGPGYYQFYSIRHIDSAEHTEIEKAPPGPDAIAKFV